MQATDDEWTVLALTRGTVLAPEASTLFQVLDGRVRYEQVADGRQAVCSSMLMAPGDAFVYRRPWLPGSPAFRIEALADSRLLALRERHIPRYVAHHPDQAERLLVALARQSEDVAEAACERALMDSRRRVLRALLRLCERQGVPCGGGLRIEVTQRDLASLTGACRETVSGIMAELARAGIVQTERGSVTVDREKALDVLDGAG